MLLPEPGNQTRASAKPPTGSAYPPGVDPPHGVSVPPLQTAAPLEELDNCRLRSPSLCQTLDGESETPFTWPPLPTAHSLVFTEFPLNSSSKAMVQLPGAPSGWVPVPVLVLGLLVLGVGVGVGVMLGLGLTLWLGLGRGLVLVLGLLLALGLVPMFVPAPTGVHFWLLRPSQSWTSSRAPRPAPQPGSVRHCPDTVLTTVPFVTVHCWLIPLSQLSRSTWSSSRTTSRHLPLMVMAPPELMVQFCAGSRESHGQTCTRAPSAWESP